MRVSSRWDCEPWESSQSLLLRMISPLEMDIAFVDACVGDMHDADKMAQWKQLLETRSNLHVRCLCPGASLVPAMSTLSRTARVTSGLP